MSNTSWLDGVRVLDFTQYLAGPACTRMLAELGAEVIKVEQPPYGDPNRGNRPRTNRRAGAHVQQNRLKKSLCVDLGTDDGVALVKELVPLCDIVVENFSKGVLDRRGLSYADLKELREDIIVASITGFGHTGPLAEKPGFEFIAQAATGVMHLTGEPDGPPMFTGIGMADTNAGVHAWGALGHALFRRERTGLGTHLDISLADCLFQMHEMAVHSESMTKGRHGAIRNGRHYATISPAGTFGGPQDWIVVFCAENQISNLFNAMGRPELIEDERFKGNPARVAHRDDLTALIEEWMATFETDRAVLDVLEAERVPCGPVLSVWDAMHYPHFVERGTIRTVADPLAGDIAVPGFPIRTIDPCDLPPVDGVAPALGEHNREVVESILGHRAGTVDRLVESGAMGEKDR
ncbi:MAG: CoA transferase [Actinomycetia bacterium]|nr:CoA transferase [Actinomycetes bacterium]MCP4958709.1 CoA transferase [Actinomycetes bacterium]